MERLREKYTQRLQALKSDFERSVMAKLDKPHRLIGIKGARGVGKTTLMLQYARKQPRYDKEVLYASLDSFWFAEHSLTELADDFVKQGGRLLLLDEVHKYPNWAQSLKNIYDDHADLKVIFTGSSLLEILQSRADLSRRAIIYTMQGLSFREYLALEVGLEMPAVGLDHLLISHTELAMEVCKELKPLAHFSDYLEHGYYPIYRESLDLYSIKLESIINLMLEVELPQLRRMDVGFAAKMRQMLKAIAESAPFVPNVSKLSERIGLNRITLLHYLHHLSDAGLLLPVSKTGKGISQLQKPDKLYLENTNLAHLLTKQVDAGTQRETFFANQTAYLHTLELPASGDFLVDGQFTFEVGGLHKGRKQLPEGPDSFRALDKLEVGSGDAIPLWLFGFLY